MLLLNSHFYLTIYLTLLPQCFVGGVKRAVPGPVHGLAAAPAANKNLYEHHFAALEQLAKPQPKVISTEGSARPSSPSRSGSGVLVLLDC